MSFSSCAARRVVQHRAALQQLGAAPPASAFFLPSSSAVFFLVNSSSLRGRRLALDRVRGDVPGGRCRRSSRPRGTAWAARRGRGGRRRGWRRRRGGPSGAGGGRLLRARAGWPCRRLCQRRSGGQRQHQRAIANIVRQLIVQPFDCNLQSSAQSHVQMPFQCEIPVSQLAPMRLRTSSERRARPRTGTCTSSPAAGCCRARRARDGFIAKISRNGTFSTGMKNRISAPVDVLNALRLADHDRS